MIKYASPREFFGISGKNSSGKNLIASIIQIINCEDKEIVEEFFDNPQDALNSYTGVFEMQSRFQNIRFSDKVNSILAEVLGVSIRKLDDSDFMMEELSQDWWYYVIGGELIPYNETAHYTNTERAKLSVYLVKSTPESLRQLICVEGGRKLINTDLWLTKTLGRCKPNELGEAPSWIISDVQFQREKDMIEGAGGSVIRVVRYKLLSEWLEDNSIDMSYMGEYNDVKMSDKDFLDFINELNSDSLKEVSEKLNHASQVELDDGDFKYVIHNNGSIEDIVNDVMEILIAEEIVTSDLLVTK
jgi:hypothetical protein